MHAAPWSVLFEELSLVYSEVSLHSLNAAAHKNLKNKSPFVFGDRGWWGIAEMCRQNNIADTY